MIDDPQETVDFSSADSLAARSLDRGLSADELLRLWRLRKEQCKRRVQKDCCVLSPMDEMPWFTLPQLTHTNLNTQSVFQILQADPMRVTLVVSAFALNVPYQSFPWVITLSNSEALNSDTMVTGICLSFMRPFLQITDKHFPGFVQGPLFATAAGQSFPTSYGICLHTLAISLKDFPQQD